MQTYAELKVELRQMIWPSGEAKSLRMPHDKMFQQAMSDLSKNIECLNNKNVTVYPYCDTYLDCPVTMLEAPLGVIKRVYTIANGQFCDKVDYYNDTLTEIRCWSKRFKGFTPPANLGLPQLQEGYLFAESSSDSPNGRARVGMFALHNRRLYVAPWIQSNESVVVEWEGVRSAWGEADQVDTDLWTDRVKNAIALYVKSKHETFYGDSKVGVELMAGFEMARADLMQDCWELTRQRNTEVCDSCDNIPTQTEIDDDAVPAAETFTVALLGDWGADGQPLADVVSSIKGMVPKRIFTLGDNIYGTPTIDSLFGKYFADYIFPYTGDYGAGASPDNLLWPAWGNHDFDFGITTLTDWFTLKNNDRYYSVVHGPVQYFILSSDPREADGGYVDATTSTQGSIMGQWLSANLALSTAKWKVVIFHHPPYTSDVNYNPGAVWMRWDFKGMGADVVLCGHAHNYEHFVVNGFNYINCGLGGHSIRNGITPKVAGSQYFWNSDYGYLLLTAECDSLKFDLYSRASALIHTVTLT